MGEGAGPLDVLTAVGRRSRDPEAGGSISGHVTPDTSWWGGVGIHVTVGDVVGCAEGVVHEVGHLRVHALGIDVEHHDGQWLANAQDELYDSPIRKDKKRPMSAVVHAHYSYVMVTQLDVHLLAAGGRLRPAVARSATVNVGRLQEGVETLRRYARWTPRGQGWADAVLRWSDRVIAAAQRHLEAT